MYRNLTVICRPRSWNFNCASLCSCQVCIIFHTSLMIHFVRELCQAALQSCAVSLSSVIIAVKILMWLLSDSLLHGWTKWKAFRSRSLKQHSEHCQTYSICSLSISAGKINEMWKIFVDATEWNRILSLILTTYWYIFSYTSCTLLWYESVFAVSSILA